MSVVDKAVIRMYRMGTGDCFVIKFVAADGEPFNMMIDGGTWQGSGDTLSPYISNLKEFVDNRIDLLVITHEHKDHVHAFDACKELFTNHLEVKKIWMGWTENDGSPKVKQWQKSYGDKKKALAMAAQKLHAFVHHQSQVSEANAEFNGGRRLAARQQLSANISDFADLEFDIAEPYTGQLAGMKVVKSMIAKGNIEYFKPGDIVEGLERLEGIRFYILGPPLSWDEVKVETGGKGESYDHNRDLAGSDAFAAAVLGSEGDPINRNMLPFEEEYILKDQQAPLITNYRDPAHAWRMIDFDWLQSAGSLALRVHSITNNLSLALAIEFTESGRVMLFPGDAEYGSWASWHTIDWGGAGKGLTEDLLNRTVFYKVAHHLSHHGTAQRLGLNMMINPDLVAMATLDYAVISRCWLSTMPNKALLSELIAKTKGRLMVMNTDDIYYDHPLDTIKLEDKIREARKRMNSKDAAEFKQAFVEHPLYLEYSVRSK